MFDIGWSELLIVAAVALLVIGPKELPATLRTLGHWATRVRRMASEFQDQFREAMREAEVADLKKDFDSMTDETKFSFAAVGNIKNEIESSFTESMQAPSAPAAPTQSASETVPPEPVPAVTEQAPVAVEPPATPEPAPATADAGPDSDGKQPA